MDNFFSTNLKKIRENKKMNRSQFAELLGVNQSNIVRWEEEERTPSIDAVIDISNKLKVPLDELIGNDLRIENDVVLDETHKLNTIVMDNLKTLTDEEKQKIIAIIDVIKGSENK